jgi:hypothetical protein
MNTGVSKKCALYVALLAGSVVACSTEPGGDVSGSWDLVESMSSQTGIACEMTGEFLLSQASNGPSFDGLRVRTATCTNAPDGFELRTSGADNVLHGRVEGLTVTFNVDFCDYEGTLAEPVMSGTMECDEDPDLSGQSVLFTGTWQATRK